MIIDGHVYACGEFLTPESIINKLESSGVEKVVLIQGELENQKYLISTIDKHSGQTKIIVNEGLGHSLVDKSLYETYIHGYLFMN